MRIKLITVIIIVSFFQFQQTNAQNVQKEINDFNEYNWWPEQPIPDGIVRADKGASHGEDALLYSLAGLVAKAQKEGEIDELIWINGGGSIYDDKWYDAILQRLGAEERGSLDVWELLERYKNEDFIAGYILYNPEDNSELRSDMDFSYNIAVSYAGAENAVVIDESLETELQNRGYTKILDARDVSREDYFDNLKNNKNRDLIVTMNPVFHNNMDFAIANNAMVSYDTDIVTEEIMEWVNPVSPVVGWNVDEYTHTMIATVNGLFNTASDWAHNLILLSAGAEEANFEKVNTLDPKTIDFDKEGHFHSFIMSDGDNIQWTLGNFIENKSYWGSSYHGDFPIGFSNPPINLSLIAPDVLDEIAASQPEHTTVIEYGPGGYHFPDKFADKRDNKEEIRREFARKMNHNLEKTGVNVIGFISDNVTSPEAVEAYKILAEEIEGLAGMIAVDFAPYHGGGGKVIWVENQKGDEIPVVTARYSLWKDLGGFRAGDPEQVAGAINEDAANADSPTMDWTAVHAWSEFENPENSAHKAQGMLPVRWTIDLLDDGINVVSPEELIWRIREARTDDDSTEPGGDLSDEDNLVVNHNFVDGFEGWSILGGKAGEDYELLDSPNNNGQMVVYFTGAQYNPSEGGDNIELLANSMAVEAGVEYTVRAYIRTWDGPEGDVPSNIKLRFFSADDQEGEFNFEGEDFINLPGTTNGEWQFLEITTTAPEAADVADIVFDTFGSAGDIEAEINIDAVYLAKTELFTSTENDVVLSEQPKQMQLHQNYPNPFNPSTQIEFSLSEATTVSLEVYTLLGQHVSTLVNKNLNAGVHRVNFDGSSLSSGIYIYRLRTDNYSEVRRMSLIK
jgi:hypothetical protein